MTNRENISAYLKESYSNAIKNQNHLQLFGGKIQVYIKEPASEDVDLAKVFDNLQRLIPVDLFYNVDIIVVGNLKEFEENNTNALYQDRAIYVSSHQDNEKDMLDDIVHELAHSIEEYAQEEIYGDLTLEREFLGKRKRLLDILKQEGYNIRDDFTNSDYSKTFDEFLYKDIGYPTLVSLTMGLFVSPYAVTSLREYFANGFENYFLEDRRYLRKLSPYLFNKIQNIVEGE
tara:strand:- start:5921 stop:6613 length:693 start_codon:yes stop_codon:yes gene_type:complete